MCWFFSRQKLMTTQAKRNLNSRIDKNNKKLHVNVNFLLTDVLGTFPRIVMYLLAFSLAIFIICFGAIITDWFFVWYYSGCSRCLESFAWRLLLQQNTPVQLEWNWKLNWNFNERWHVVKWMRLTTSHVCIIIHFSTALMAFVIWVA